MGEMVSASSRAQAAWSRGRHWPRFGLARLRLTLLSIEASLGGCLLASIVAAAGFPRAVPLRLGLLFVAWAQLGLLLARLFLPGFDPIPGRLLRRLPRSAGARAIALTFDDGPHPDTTPSILAALAAARIRATFFLVGEQVRRHPELARRIVAEGHAIGNHTERHRLLVFRTDAEVRAEIESCQDTIAGAVGIRPSLFRAPHGFRPVGLSRIVRPLGLRVVAWQGAARDTDAPGIENIVVRTLHVARARRILLLHDNPTSRGETAGAIPRIVVACRARGLVFVRLDELAKV